MCSSDLRLEIAMEQARENGYLGKNIFGSGFDFDIRIKAGAGAFVCGEETALIASLEGESSSALRRVGHLLRMQGLVCAALLFLTERSLHRRQRYLLNGDTRRTWRGA